MKKYRVKQVGDRFYPQHKKTFGWGYYKGHPFWTYSLMLEKIIDWKELYFNSFEEANNFLIEQKKSDTIIYHEIKENNN